MNLDLIAMKFKWDPRLGFVKNTEKVEDQEIEAKVYGQPLDSGYAWIVLIAASITSLIYYISRHTIDLYNNQSNKNAALNTSSSNATTNVSTTSTSYIETIDNDAFKYSKNSLIFSGTQLII